MDSCYGKVRASDSRRAFSCAETESKLLNCRSIRTGIPGCLQAAGVQCGK